MAMQFLLEMLHSKCAKMTSTLFWLVVVTLVVVFFVVVVVVVVVAAWTPTLAGQAVSWCDLVSLCFADSLTFCDYRYEPSSVPSSEW